MISIKKKIESFPLSPGVYLFSNKKRGVIYIGKAANLRRRVKSYYSGSRDKKALKIAQEAEKVEFRMTETVVEALVKEAELIKKYNPWYNVKEKDDRSFLYVVITKEKYPRVLLQRQKERKEKEERSSFGPFTSSTEIRRALRIIRKIFPFSTHTEKEIGKGSPCFYHEIGLCPGTCVGKIERKDYLKEIKNIELFLEGKKKKVLHGLKKDMEKASKELRFEEAGILKKKINALSYMQDTALITNKKEEEGIRIEGYDVSNISGSFAVGAMVVFSGGVFQKSDYRLFKIRKIIGSDDVGMIREVIERRMGNDWPLPSFIFVDGGRGQINAVEEVLEKEGVKIPVVGIAKGEKRKEDKVIGGASLNVNKDLLIKVRDEAHRFALSYHRKLRKKDFLSKKII